jgi:hypothetical protein
VSIEQKVNSRKKLLVNDVFGLAVTCLVQVYRLYCVWPSPLGGEELIMYTLTSGFSAVQMRVVGLYATAYGLNSAQRMPTQG